MGLINHSKKEEKNQPPELPDAPPLYEILQQEHSAPTNEDVPQYSGNYGPNEYPPEKGHYGTNQSYAAGEGSSTQYIANQGYAPGGISPQYPPNQGYGQYPPNQGYGQYPPNQGYGQNQYGNVYTVPQNTYVVAPQMVNIAYETDGRNTRPGYSEYLQNNQQGPSGRSGAPLAPAKKSKEKTGGSRFPGASNTTYYNAAKK